MFCMPVSVRASVRPRLFRRYLQYLLTDFRLTFVIGASWDKDELIGFFGVKRSKVKVTLFIVVEASSTRRCRRVQVSSPYALSSLVGRYEEHPPRTIHR